MKICKWFLILILGFCASVMFGAEIISDYSFSNVEDLKTWQTAAGASIPDSGKLASFYTLEMEEGLPFLRTKSTFGILAKLKKDITIDEKTEYVEVSVLMRKPANTATLAAFALTSRVKYQEGAFTRARDSGFGIKGYQYSNQSANCIYWRRDGEMNVFNSPREPFGLLDAETGKKSGWFEWKLIYDHRGHTLSFYRKDETKPFIIQRNVDLTGIVLSGVWLHSDGLEYQKAIVKHITK